ncbi:MAG: M20/M25/M40 family metallo-hydrolase [Candidatus Promineifilaceae bacterium]
MNIIKRLAADSVVKAALHFVETQTDTAVSRAIAVQQIPAPTFAEAERAAYIEAQFRQLGLVDVDQDELHNVYGRYPSPQPLHPPVVVTAHSDTVFPAETDLTIRKENGRIYGPGLGDNSTGVAGLFTLADTLRQNHLTLPADIWFVANVGEEGLGDLNGMRRVVSQFGGDATYLVIEGGLFGQISHQAIGVRRYRITVTAPGGHSWGQFGSASAIHVLGQLIADIARLEVPASPKTTYNVGVISGGTSINTIAQSAELLLDLRSETPEALAELESRVMVLTDQLAATYRAQGVTIDRQLIGDRPAGQLPAAHPLVQTAAAALRFVGYTTPRFVVSSTDANIPLSKGYTAVCIGLTESGNAHRLDEFMDPAQLVNGMQQALLLLLAAAKYMA